MFQQMQIEELRNILDPVGQARHALGRQRQDLVHDRPVIDDADTVEGDDRRAFFDLQLLRLGGICGFLFKRRHAGDGFAQRTVEPMQAKILEEQA